MKVFIDTNVMLDFLGEREKFYLDAAKIATLADQKKITLVVSALSYATVSYFITKYEGIEKTKNKLRKFKVLSSICELDEKIIEQSLGSEFKDFEDALQYFSALRTECNVLITRNEKDFKLARLPIMNPKEFLNSL
jgi:predicted nucleic acid-binding protein